MRRTLAAIAGAAWLVSSPAAPWAASLQVSPVSIDVPAPGAATTITLRNVGSDPLNAQIRVFRWAQVDGEEQLQPTDEVVASPPSATLAPNTDYTVRLVRVSKQPVAAAESYRLLVDELPAPAAAQSREIRLVMRYSVPVFFEPRQADKPNLAWSLEERGGQVYLSAANSGDQHIRVAALKLREGATTVASFGDGLLGYVLGRSTMRWKVPGNPQLLGRDRSIEISAQSDSGPINATVSAPRPN